MSDQMYMNGKGIMRRTTQLVDSQWKYLVWFLAGLYAGGIGLGVSVMYLGATPLGYFVDACMLGGGLPLMYPWVRGTFILQRHIRAMRREIEKRGKGWAES